MVEVESPDVVGVADDDRVDESKWKFRTFLLQALEHFLIDKIRRDHAQKRGGNITHIALDGLAMEAHYRMEPLTTETPETLYDRHLAEAMLSRATERLTKNATASPRAAFTMDLLPHVTGGLPPGVADDIGQRHGLTGGAVSAALHRLRGQWKKNASGKKCWKPPAVRRQWRRKCGTSSRHWPRSEG